MHGILNHLSWTKPLGHLGHGFPVQPWLSCGLTSQHASKLVSVLCSHCSSPTMNHLFCAPPPNTQIFQSLPLEVHHYFVSSLLSLTPLFFPPFIVISDPIAVPSKRRGKALDLSQHPCVRPRRSDCWHICPCKIQPPYCQAHRIWWPCDIRSPLVPSMRDLAILLPLQDPAIQSPVISSCLYLSPWLSLLM